MGFNPRMTAIVFLAVGMLIFGVSKILFNTATMGSKQESELSIREVAELPESARKPFPTGYPSRADSGGQPPERITMELVCQEREEGGASLYIAKVDHEQVDIHINGNKFRCNLREE